jgi:prepilin-type processing-associated H-X9-DG protein
MTPLNPQQKQLLFDYALGLASESEAREAERLLANHEEAAKMHLVFKHALSPLDNWDNERCPDRLVDATVARFRMAAEQEEASRRPVPVPGLKAKGPRIIRTPLLGNFSNIAAMAAAIVLIVWVIVPALGLSRQKHFQERCEFQLKGVYAGLSQYVDDHDGQLPHVATVEGAPWWKVGDQGQENESNTRHAWLLVKQGYLKSDSFLCPACGKARVDAMDRQQARQYNDFPSRQYVQFSMRVCCPQFQQMGLKQARPILADLNPLSERLPADLSASRLSVRLGKDLMGNSPNHNRRGQNVLFCDGSVEFSRTRTARQSADDIYTLSQMSDGCEITGTETPANAEDAFLVP